MGRCSDFILRSRSQALCLDFPVVRMPVARVGYSDHVSAPAAGFIWGGGINAGFGDHHVFAPFTLFAFVVAEGVRFRRRRKPDYPLWAALLLPMLSMLFYIPLIRAFGGLVVRDPASYHTIIFFFEETLAGQIMVFVLLSALLVPLRERPRNQDQEFSAEEIALIGLHVSKPDFVESSPDASPRERFTIDIVCRRRWRSSWLSLSFLPTACG